MTTSSSPQNRGRAFWHWMAIATVTVVTLGWLIFQASTTIAQAASSQVYPLAAVNRHQEPDTPTPTDTETATATSTDTATATSTATNTSTATDTATSTNTATVTSTATNTNSPTVTSTNTPTATATQTSTSTTTHTATPTPTITGTPPTATRTATSTVTGTLPTPTRTTTPTLTGTITPAVTISVGATPTEVKANQSITFEIKVQNAGLAPAVNCVVTSNDLNSLLTITSATTTRGNATVNGRSISVTIGTIAPNETVTILVIAKVASSVSQTNSYTFTVTGTYDPSQSKNGSASYKISTGTGLPNTGQAPLETSDPPGPDWSMLFIGFSLGLAALFTIWYGSWAKKNQAGGASASVFVGVILAGAAMLTILSGLGLFGQNIQNPSPSILVENSPTPEMLAGYAIAPAFEPLAPGHLPSNPKITPQPIPTLPSYPVPTPTIPANLAQGTATPDTSAIIRLVIPGLNVDAEVKYVPFDTNLHTWLIDGLRQEIAWLGDTSWPGLGSNTVLAGHVTVRDYGNGPFRYLDQLKPGDTFTIYTQAKAYTYRVREQQVVREDELWVTQPTEKAQITLITCTDWNRELQSYQRRLVVFADLQTSDPVTQGSK